MTIIYYVYEFSDIFLFYSFTNDKLRRHTMPAY